MNELLCDIKIWLHMCTQSYTQKHTHNWLRTPFSSRKQEDTEDYQGQFKSLRDNKGSLHWPKLRDLEHGRKLLKLILRALASSIKEERRMKEIKKAKERQNVDKRKTGREREKKKRGRKEIRKERKEEKRREQQGRERLETTPLEIARSINSLL